MSVIFFFCGAFCSALSRDRIRDKRRRSRHRPGPEQMPSQSPTLPTTDFCTELYPTASSYLSWERGSRCYRFRWRDAKSSIPNIGVRELAKMRRMLDSARLAMITRFIISYLQTGTQILRPSLVRLEYWLSSHSILRRQLPESASAIIAASMDLRTR